jgi:hypothetical protein
LGKVDRVIVEKRAILEGNQLEDVFWLIRPKHHALDRRGGRRHRSFAIEETTEDVDLIAASDSEGASSEPDGIVDGH